MKKQNKNKTKTKQTTTIKISTTVTTTTTTTTKLPYTLRNALVQRIWMRKRIRLKWMLLLGRVIYYENSNRIHIVYKYIILSFHQNTKSVCLSCSVHRKQPLEPACYM